MSDIVGCGYIGLASPDPAAWRRFGNDLGLQLAEGSSDERLLFRMDDRAYRICVERGPIGPNNGVLYVGWEVRDEAALDRLAERLRSAGFQVTEDEGIARIRLVDRLVHCVDPGGSRVEFFCGPLVPRQRFVSPQGVRFVTRAPSGQELGLGHVVTSFDDEAAAQRFYFDLLGFRLTDYCLLPDRFTFTRVNPRHHSLAFARYDGPSVFHHFMIEVASIDEVGECNDRMMTAAVPFTASIGRHNNDRMFSFYVVTPSGIELEYGCEGVLIDDSTHVPPTYKGSRIWGHHNASRAIPCASPRAILPVR